MRKWAVQQIGIKDRGTQVQSERPYPLQLGLRPGLNLRNDGVFKQTLMGGCPPTNHEK